MREIESKVEVVDVDFDIIDIENLSILKRKSSQKLYNSSTHFTFFMKNSLSLRC